MFGEGAISSSESPAPSGSGVPERGVPETVFSFRMLWIGEGARFRCSALDSCHTKLKWSGGPWSMPLVRVGAHTAPVPCNWRRGWRGLRHRSLTPIWSRPPNWCPPPYRSFGPSYPAFGTGPTFSPEQVVDLFRTGLTQCSGELGKSGSVPEHRISLDPEPFRIPSAWRFRPAGWDQHPHERLAQAPPLLSPRTTFRWAFWVDSNRAPARGYCSGGTTFWISFNRSFIVCEYFTRIGSVCQAEDGSVDSTIWS